MSERDERVGALAEVLAEHREDFSDHCCHWHDGCGCGWTDEPDDDSTHAAYVRHLAATLLHSPAMRDLLAEERRVIGERIAQAIESRCGDDPRNPRWTTANHAYAIAARIAREEAR